MSSKSDEGPDIVNPKTGFLPQSGRNITVSNHQDLQRKRPVAGGTPHTADVMIVGVSVKGIHGSQTARQLFDV